jgi:hypothetical protein
MSAQLFAFLLCKMDSGAGPQRRKSFRDQPSTAAMNSDRFFAA